MLIAGNAFNFPAPWVPLWKKMLNSSFLFWKIKRSLSMKIGSIVLFFTQGYSHAFQVRVGKTAWCLCSFAGLSLTLLPFAWASILCTAKKLCPRCVSANRFSVKRFPTRQSFPESTRCLFNLSSTESGEKGAQCFSVANSTLGVVTVCPARLSNLAVLQLFLL